MNHEAVKDAFGLLPFLGASALSSLAGKVQQLLASGGVKEDTLALELNHATVAIAATIGTTVGRGLFIVKNTSASGTANHTVTITTGTWNGTNKVATFAIAANKQFLIVWFDSAGNGSIIENVGTVAFSG